MKLSTLRKHKRISYLEAIIMILFFVAIIISFSFGFSGVKSTTHQEQINEATNSVKKAVILCYSIEGEFPPDIEYLKDNYNLIVNDDKYIIHYNVFASNVMPEIVLFSRK